MIDTKRFRFCLYWSPLWCRRLRCCSSSTHRCRLCIVSIVRQCRFSHHRRLTCTNNRYLTMSQVRTVYLHRWRHIVTKSHSSYVLHHHRRRRLLRFRHNFKVPMSVEFHRWCCRINHDSIGNFGSLRWVIIDTTIGSWRRCIDCFSFATLTIVQALLVCSIKRSTNQLQSDWYF